MKLHHVPWSRSFRVLWLIEELALECDVALYKIGQSQLRAPEYLARSPGGRVPALEVGEVTLFESGAIVQWLCESYGPELDRPVGHPERAAFLQALAYAETMASLIEQLNLNHVFLRDPSQASPVVIKLNTARLKATIAGLEGMLGDQAYLLPSGFSGADTMMGFNLFAAPFFVDLEPFAAVSAYRERIMTRPAFKRAAAREGPQQLYSRDFYPVPTSPKGASGAAPGG